MGKKKKAGKTNDVYILEFHSVRKRNHRYYNSNRRSCVMTRSKRSEKGQKSGTEQMKKDLSHLVPRSLFMSIGGLPLYLWVYTNRPPKPAFRPVALISPPSFRIPVAPVLFFSRKDHGTSSLCQVQCHRFSYLALLLFLSLIRYLFPPPQYSRLNFILLRFLRIYFSTSSSV